MTSIHDDRPELANDAALLGRAVSGDEGAFRSLYERHVGAVRGYVIGRVGPDHADDIVSETFADAWRACVRFDPRAASARPWLYGIATNVVARHREREQRWIDHRTRSATAAPPGHVPEPTAYDLDPQLAAAVGRLSPALRDVLLLTALADMSVAEAGRALQITATTARVRLLRARRQVQQFLEGGPR